MAQNLGGGIPSPSSLEDVEQLVLRFYQPGQAQQIQQAEKQLRDLQNSPEGWKIADFLLSRPDSSVRYFGALTFQINLNTKGNTLDDDELASLGDRLIQWILTEHARGDVRLVLQKLCSTFAVYCVQERQGHGESCVKQLVCSLLEGKPISAEATKAPNLPPLSTLVQNLNQRQLLICLKFLKNLTEEASIKIVGYPAETVSNIISRMKANLRDAVTILDHCFSSAGERALGQEATSTRLQALVTLADWVFFAQKAWQGSEESLIPLRTLLDPALAWLPTVDAEDESAAIDVFTDLLSNFGMFFQEKHLATISQIITSPWGMDQMHNVIEDPEDVSAFAKLVLAFADVMIGTLATDPNSSTTKEMMAMIHSLTTCSGTATVDDRCIVEALEFWNAFVEFVVDSDFEDDGPRPWLDYAKGQIAQAFQELWIKIRWPLAEVYSALDSDKQKEFRQFRADVADLLVSAYPVLKAALTEAIARGCLDALHRQSWLEVEASLFSLNAISIGEQETEDRILVELFGSNLYAELKNPESLIPAKTRRTAVDLLGQYAEFFERQTTYLPPALDFLFASLQSAALAQQAAKSIASLCSSCRASLTSQLANFVEAYQRFLSWPTADQYTKEKVIGGVAAIIQALPSHADQANGLTTLLQFVDHDIQAGATHFANNNYDEAQVSVAIAMSCLVGMAKASQAPGDVPDTSSSNGASPDFWRSGPGTVVQDHICQSIRMAMQIFEQSQLPLELHGEVLESICVIFKSGFSEATPGPFVLPAKVVVDFFATVHAKTPRLEIILNMACAFLRSHSIPSSPRIDTEAGLLLQHLTHIIQTVEDPRSEAEISSGLIEVLTRYMPQYTNVLLQAPSQENLAQLFTFTLNCLIVPEYLPKRKSAEFWATFIALPPRTSPHLDEVLLHFGPILAHHLINQVSGNATRTDLDWFTEPLRSFNKRHVQTKKWLEAAMTSPDFPAPSVALEVRGRFLKGLGVANSGPATRRVVLAYWSQCKGLAGSGYAP